MGKGSSEQKSSTSTATSVTDNRVGVADQGVYAGAGATVAQGNDFRSFDDHSVFAVQTTDNRVTNVTTLDADLARDAIAGNVAATKAATESSTRLMEAALNYGEGVTSDAFKSQNAVVEAGFGVVNESNKRSLDFGAAALKAAVDVVAKSADADRAFASEFTGRIFDAQKGADQANTEKIVRAGTIVVGIVAAAFTAKAIFGKSSQ